MSAVPVHAPNMQEADKETMFVCPYDASHRIASRRFVRHILKCRKNHPDADKSTCPFNARHIVPTPEYQAHIVTCPDRRAVDREIKHQRFMRDGDEVRGNTCVPEYTSREDLDFGNDEDWDAEMSQSESQSNRNTVMWPSSRYQFETNIEERRLMETPMEQRPQQTSQPFPMERRPFSNPILSSRVLGTGRGRILNNSTTVQNPTRDPSFATRAGPPPSLAANFSVQTNQWTTVGRTESPLRIPRQGGRGIKRLPPSSHTERPHFEDDIIATRDIDQDLERSLASINRMTREMRLREEEYNMEQFADDSTTRGRRDRDVTSHASNSAAGSSFTAHGRTDFDIDSASPKPSSHTEELAAFKKERRKLIKSLKQIENIETKLQENKPVNDDEMAKLCKKAEIKARLKELERKV